MRSWLGHEWMLTYFLATGLLFFWPILGVAPAPRRLSRLLRVLELFIGMPFHAFFGIAVMMSSTLIATFFAHPPAAWHLLPLADQNTGGGIAWAFSDIPTLLVLMAVLVQWAGSGRRTAARIDRQADRDHDAELTAYLARLAARDNSAFRARCRCMPHTWRGAARSAGRRRCRCGLLAMGFLTDELCIVQI
jgi:putative membrane protein